MDIQTLVDTMSDIGKRDRSNYHLTLGKFMQVLKEAIGTNPKMPVKSDKGGSIGLADSYRGYYSDLAFRPSKKIKTVKNVLDICMVVFNKSLIGYKGGDFLMDEKTPLWISEYGECSYIAIVEAKFIKKTMYLITKNVDE